MHATGCHRVKTFQRGGAITPSSSPSNVSETGGRTVCEPLKSPKDAYNLRHRNRVVCLRPVLVVSQICGNGGEISRFDPYGFARLRPQ